MKRLFLAAMLIALAACTAQPTTGPAKPQSPAPTARGASGPARVIDGDTLAIGDTRIRLFGIDAPELRQSCQRSNGARWACGAWSKGQLQALVGRGAIRCVPRDTDRYGRMVGVCYANGQDVNAAMIARGAAIAYRRYAVDYVPQERTAKAARQGIWQGPHVTPASYRRASSHSAKPPEQAPNSNCVVKGNISAAGKIYHVPGQRDYANTRISARKGERWFCSAAEAIAAGWRPARR